MRLLLLMVLGLTAFPASAYGHAGRGHYHAYHPGPRFHRYYYYPHPRYYGYGYYRTPLAACPCGSAVACYTPRGNPFCILPNGYRQYLPY